jgi:hypothetical protein
MMLQILYSSLRKRFSLVNFGYKSRPLGQGQARQMIQRQNHENDRFYSLLLQEYSIEKNDITARTQGNPLSRVGGGALCTVPGSDRKRL